MEREHLPGTIKIFPGIAEELLGGKAYFVRAGVFKDVDAVLFNHIGSNFSVSWGASMGSGLVVGRVPVRGRGRPTRRARRGAAGARSTRSS